MNENEQKNQEILPFETYEYCLKCGGQLKSTIADGYGDQVKVLLCNGANQFEVNCKEKKEHLHCMCERCRYRWLEYCADHQEEDPMKRFRNEAAE
jgi:hypothetical protein